MSRAPKHCGVAGCPELVQGRTYCPEHLAERMARQDARRAGTSARGYGHTHMTLRGIYARRMANGEAFTCTRCLEPIQPGSAWDLGHDDEDRSRYTGPEHRSCNRAAPQYARRA